MNHCLRISAVCVLLAAAVHGQTPDATTNPAGAEPTEPSQPAGRAEYGADDARAADQSDDPLVQRANDALRARQDGGQAGSPLGSSRAVDLIVIGRVLVGLCVVLALIALIVFVWKRLGPKTPLLAGASLGSVLGRLYLDRQAKLFFVETGGRVLVLGVTNNTVSLVSEFDEEAFHAVIEGEADEPPSDAQSFLDQLQQSAQAMRQQSVSDSDDMSSLRGDVQRMRRMLEDEESRMTD